MTESDNSVAECPVSDWTTDWDHHDPRWTADPFPIWDDLRATCPVAHTERYNEGVWLPTRYDDVTGVAQNPTAFSSGHSGVSAGGTIPRPKFPPIHLDPPDHAEVRRAMLPFFSPKRIESWRPHVEAFCNQLIDGLAERHRSGGTIDAAADYAAHRRHSRTAINPRRGRPDRLSKYSVAAHAVSRHCRPTDGVVR